MTIFDQIVLLATGLISFYLLVMFYKSYRKNGGNYNIYYILSFSVLLISGLLLIILGYDILSNPLVVIVAAIIPIFLSVGLIAEFAKKYQTQYLIFAVIGIVLIAITRYVGPDTIGTIILATIHSIAALIILLTPIIVVKQGKAPVSFSFVTIGGLLISIGGISLAFLKVGIPILSAEIIFAILAPILFLMSLCFAYGFLKKKTVSQSKSLGV